MHITLLLCPRNPRSSGSPQTVFGNETIAFGFIIPSLWDAVLSCTDVASWKHFKAITPLMLQNCAALVSPSTVILFFTEDQKRLLGSSGRYGTKCCLLTLPFSQGLITKPLLKPKKKKKTSAEHTDTQTDSNPSVGSAGAPCAICKYPKVTLYQWITY